MLYPLQHGTDLSFLKGRELVQLVISRHQVIFRFDEDVTVSVEDAFEAGTALQMQRWTPETLESAAAVIPLLGRKVVTLAAGADSSIEMIFTGETYLRLTPQVSAFESYQITHAGRVLAV